MRSMRSRQDLCRYIPNIATFMVENPSIVGKNLSGIAVGAFGSSKVQVH